MEMTRLDVVVFTDYICPFCYIGDRRLSRLADRYDLSVDHRFFEIRPDTPSSGMPLSELGYLPDRWRQMMENLARMAEGEKISLAEREFTTNSRKAMLLAMAAKEDVPGAFGVLHEMIFATFFSEGRNIGDDSVLRKLSEEAGVPASTVERAWTDPSYGETLAGNRELAARIGITGVPSFIIGNRLIEGAVPADTLRAAARDAVRSAS